MAATSNNYIRAESEASNGISTLIVVDIRFYREGLADILTRNGRIKAVHTADSFQTAEDLLETESLNVVLVDTGAAGAMSGLTRARRRFPHCKFVVLAAREDHDDLLRCAEIGVAGYVSQEDSVHDVVETILGAVTGGFSCSANAGASLLRRMAESVHFRTAAPRLPQLTPRQNTVMNLMTRGLSNKQIASKLLIEVSTVKNHVHTILEKCDVHTRAEAVAKASASRIDAG